MPISTFHFPTLVVSQAAAAKLQELKSQTGYSLLFALQRGKSGVVSLIICHATEAEGFVVDIGGVAVSLTKSLLRDYVSVDIGFMADAGCGQGSFVLSENEHIVSSLPVSSALTRLHEVAYRMGLDEHGGFAYQMMG